MKLLLDKGGSDEMFMCSHPANELLMKHAVWILGSRLIQSKSL